MTDSPRRLVLLRHAKAAAEDAGVDDRARPLAPRGEADAPAAGRWLREHALLPDLVVCSPALRARRTWERAAAAAAGEACPVRVDQRVYEASVRVLADVVRETPDEVDTLVLVGHNPGIQGLAVHLAVANDAPVMSRVYEDFPTNGLAVLRPGGRWSDLGPGGAELLDFTVPRA